MTHAEIIKYARKRGAKNVRLYEKFGNGWILSGSGTVPYPDLINDRPLIWVICEELGMSFGCGWGTGTKNLYEHQCSPDRAKLPGA